MARRLTSVGALGASIGSGWTQSDINSFASPGSANIYTSTTQATLCKRYQNGVLTSTPLWPWPMDSRIVAGAARTCSSMNQSALLDTFTSVSHMVSSLFGAPPAQCTQ